MNLLWGLLVVVFPVLSGTYYFVLSAVGGRVFGYKFQERHNSWLYVPFVAAFTVAVLYSFPLELPFTFRPYYLLFLVVGVGMYQFDVAIVAYQTGRRATKGRQRLRWMVPVLAIAPAEEVVFRGIPTVVLAEYGAIAYVASSSVLFGIVHHREGKREVALKTANGVVYCLLYVATGSLLSPMLAHVGYNLAYIYWAVGGFGNKR
ncbi:CPBP family intramembrane glutamic endopeptidase [Haladaptatus cibarius]|uniref:CPBP family intramembrane glutamic endopeptidase n=1 Tax=Haladaptatus cibarius TaxID=453847 RepID=UPI0006790E42|nr:type II CAAX endopeptidase family protein [Haladaptatus cibarius]